MDTRNALTPAEYWEWRCTISDMNLAREILNKTELECKLIQKDAEILAGRAEIYRRTKVSQTNDKYLSTKVEYDRFKGVLEERLGISLDNKMIDEISYEIRDLPK